MVCNFVYYLKLYHIEQCKFKAHCSFTKTKNTLIQKMGDKFVFMCEYGVLFFLFGILNKKKSNLTNAYAIFLCTGNYLK